MADGPQIEPTIHLPPTPNIPTLCALFAEPQRQHHIIIPEATPA